MIFNAGEVKHGSLTVNGMIGIAGLRIVLWIGFVMIKKVSNVFLYFIQIHANKMMKNAGVKH